MHRPHPPHSPEMTPLQGPCTRWERGCSLGLKPQGPGARPVAGPPSPAPGEAESTPPTHHGALTGARGHRGGRAQALGIFQSTPLTPSTCGCLPLKSLMLETSRAWWPWGRALSCSSDVIKASCPFSAGPRQDNKGAQKSSGLRRLPGLQSEPATSWLCDLDKPFSLSVLRSLL